MFRIMSIIKQTGLIVSMSLLIVQLVSADGLRNPPPGAVGIGKIGGNKAHIDDASALYINPANITDIDKVSTLISVTFGYQKKEFDPLLGGRSFDTKDRWAPLPNAYVVWPSEDGAFRYGIGITTAYGRGAKWDDSINFLYSSPTFGQLGVIDINPTIATKLRDDISIAFGLDIYYSKLKLRQFFPWSAFTGNPVQPDGKAEFDADGYALGGNVALSWQATEKQRLSLIYRSSFDVDYDGDFKISNVPAAASSIGVSSQSDYDTEIKYPSIVALGYGIALNDVFNIGVDVEWLEQSRFKALPVDLANNNVLLPSRSIPQEWDDNWTFGVGCDWKCSPHWVLRAGYIFLQTPTPTDTLMPIGAESDLSVISFGFSYLKEGHQFDFGYGYGIYDDLEVSDHPDPTVNGDYDLSSHLVSIGYTRMF